MSRFPADPGRQAGAADVPADPYAAAVARLAKYPSLGSLFGGAHAEGLGEMRRRLARTERDLAQVISSGPAEDAARAESASRAYGAALALLDDLESLRKARARDS